MHHQIMFKPWWLRHNVSSLLLKTTCRPLTSCLPTSHNKVSLNYLQCQRCYSTPRRPNFLSQFVENIKQEMAKNKEMKENLKKFREEAQRLEHSEALQKARQKYQTVESEASKTSEVLRESLGSIKDRVQETLDEVSKTEIAKKAGQIREEIGKTAKGAAESISESGQKLGKSGAFQTISQTAAAVKQELDTTGMQAYVYRTPVKLRMRKDVSELQDNKTVEANTDATGVELHKDSKFYESWQNFKDNNPYVNKVLDWKIKYDESDNPVIRATRLFTDKVTDVMGGLFQKTELSETLTEICKLDPNFDKSEFLRECETDIIPNILEAMIRGELDILKDWCHEGAYNVLSTPLRQAKQLGYKFASKVLDIDNVDLYMGKVMDQGPILVITFTSQQILCVKDSKGNVIEGDPDKILRVNYTWVLCRDKTELNPKAAWRLLEFAAQSSEQLV
ncbi:mitochondrial import inner membrane translocase subunit TIM44-like [Macrosteles quadrilineatus]|uniref:mitochondrial import inner membrane translocase subunit TIM44-like n=1 Tax=Macrosteles quadrilineatus TaxID=74068 RepID=UPI0023E0E413|nr:mitochondrial import inner membrane translocase subunit TIM44-like [Macrosteles quadrilineatus]XP_054264404.1 mitochondrial import inner membrane translocase subunit TIM44-like [Macrosteles quadrilineatus]